VGPRLTEHPREREKHRPGGELHRDVPVAHDVAAGIHDQRV
jgi:hypothetical protein